jgi:hypothetical protein
MQAPHAPKSTCAFSDSKALAWCGEFPGEKAFNGNPGFHRLYMISFYSRNIKAAFTSRPNPKYFIFHPSHQIFRRMHEALNVGKKDN